MTATTSVQHQPKSSNDPASDFGRPIEATIRAFEQQASDLEEAHYEALREARDASRRAAELRLQALETRMRLCALVECEPINANQQVGATARRAVLRLMHVHFDEPGIYRLVLCLLETQFDQTSEGVDVPAWCSKVVYDATRPEGRCPITISDAVRAAYRAAEQQGYRLMWDERAAP